MVSSLSILKLLSRLYPSRDRIDDIISSLHQDSVIHIISGFCSLAKICRSVSLDKILRAFKYKTFRVSQLVGCSLLRFVLSCSFGPCCCCRCCCRCRSAWFSWGRVLGRFWPSLFFFAPWARASCTSSFPPPLHSFLHFSFLLQPSCCLLLVSDGGLVLELR